MARRGLRKLLIANRGEIALRIIRSARLMGFKTIAVYSDADAGSAHVAAADEGPADRTRRGPAELPECRGDYRRAKSSGADAIHPGYGFLVGAPRVCAGRRRGGIIFVGPPGGGDGRARRQAGRASARLGNRRADRPGTDIADADSARSFAAQAGFPILVKAVAGGGGRGMRVIAERAT